MAYFDPRKYVVTLQDWINYNGDIQWDGYQVMKNHGNFIELNIPSSSSEGHDTYELYLDDDGRLVKVIGHRHNAGFSGTKYL